MIVANGHGNWLHVPMVVAFFLVLACSEAKPVQPRSPAQSVEPQVTSYNTIAREKLVEMFQNMGTTAGWDLSQDMLWGYFFTDEQAAPLDALRPVLEQRGYRFVDRYLDDESTIYFLHVERIETHSVDTLHQRNEELATLAHAHGVTYDGMDVGPQTKPE
jgi:hypothetical protein